MRLIAVFKFTIVRSRFIFVFPNLMVALNCLTNTLNLVGYYLALVPLLTPLSSGRVIMLIVRVNWRPMAPPPNGRATYTSTSTSTGNRGQDIKRRGFINPKRQAPFPQFSYPAFHLPFWEGVGEVKHHTTHTSTSRSSPAPELGAS